MLQQIGELAWRAFQSVNTRLAEGASVNPQWAPGPLPKSYERTRPPLGYPRETDSLCPRRVVEARKRILSGERDLSDLVGGDAGFPETGCTVATRGAAHHAASRKPSSKPAATSRTNHRTGLDP